MKTGNPIFKSGLAVRRNLSPVDVYCYLKARFGEPNGFQSHLRKDSSDNIIHWDFNLKAGNEDVYICGTFREVHFMLSEELTDEDWPSLIRAIKCDYGRMAKQKTEILKSLEKWVIFPNKFVAIATITADLHNSIRKHIAKGTPATIPPMFSSTVDSKAELDEQAKVFKGHIKRSGKLYRDCLELSLLTPVLAESFINMAVLILCKRQIRNNQRQFDAFIRSQIDAKVFDLPYKCSGFVKAVDQESLTYKNFKRVMDRRNDTIHGNVNPEREKIEEVYFQGRIPLFEERGDHISKYFETLTKQLKPEQVVKDYEAIYEFFASLAGCLNPSVATGFWQIMEDPRPGYDPDRKIAGCLLPLRTVVTHLQGMKYDDELPVTWKAR